MPPKKRFQLSSSNARKKNALAQKKKELSQTGIQPSGSQSAGQDNEVFIVRQNSATAMDKTRPSNDTIEHSTTDYKIIQIQKEPHTPNLQLVAKRTELQSNLQGTFGLIADKTIPNNDDTNPLHQDFQTNTIDAVECHNKPTVVSRTALLKRNAANRRRYRVSANKTETHNEQSSHSQIQSMDCYIQRGTNVNDIIVENDKCSTLQNKILPKIQSPANHDDISPGKRNSKRKQNLGSMPDDHMELTTNIIKNKGNELPCSSAIEKKFEARDESHRDSVSNKSQQHSVQSSTEFDEREPQSHDIHQSAKGKQLRQKKALYQRKYLDGAKKRANEAVHLNHQGELLSLDMHHAPSAEQMINAEHDPVVALMTMATNSGLGRFSSTTHLVNDWDAATQLLFGEDNATRLPQYIADLKSEIQENVTEDDHARIVEEFLQHKNSAASLFACGSCGVKTFRMGSVMQHTISVDQLSSLLMSTEEVAMLESIPSEFRLVSSFYTALDGRYYHLHPEFVSCNVTDTGTTLEETILCDACYEAITREKKFPIYSLAAGMNFGNTDRIDLPSLTIPEEYVISQSRLLISIVKLTGYQDVERQSGKLGHVIVFPQDGKRLEDEIKRSQVKTDRSTYPRLDNLHENISIAFVGSRLQWAALVPDRKNNQQLEVRVEVIYRWLRMLKAVNPRYKDIVIDDSPDMVHSLQRISDELLDRATIVDHDTDISIDLVVEQEASGHDTMNNGNNETSTEQEHDSYSRLPTTFLTRSSRPNTGSSSTADAVLAGVCASIAPERPPGHACESTGNLTTSADTSTATVTIVQGDEPLNEFEKNDHLLYSAFPHLFPLGKGLRKCGSVPKKDVRHMLMQAGGKMADCLRFIFLLFDQMQRHEASRVVAASVKTNAASMEAFTRLVSDPLFVKKLEHAKQHPNDPQSKTLLNKITPHLSLCNSKVPYTAAERKASVGHLLNLVRFYGTPSVFFTFSPDDTHGTLNLRMSLPLKDNCTFPSTESGFTKAIREGNLHFREIPISPASLRSILARGPVAAAELFRLTVDNVFTILMGTPPDGGGKKKITPLPKRLAGIFGKPICAFGCTEEQARGSLHMHIVFWGGLTPALLQTAGGIDGLQRMIAEAIDRIVSAELDPVIQFRHLMRDLKNRKVPPAALYTPHHPVRERERFKEDYQRTVDRSNIHQHTKTCFKTKTGKFCCRLGRPVHLENETGSIEIEASRLDPRKPTISFKIRSKIRPPRQQTTRRRNFSRTPVALRDARLIMYYNRRRAILPPRSRRATNVSPTGSLDYLNLPQEDQDEFDGLSIEDQKKIVRALVNRNGLVVEYNPVGAALLGCNTNVSILGSDAQAKAALAYLLKYVTKPPAELAESLSILHYARRTIELHPSKAADTGTPQRTAMHYLNRIVNQLSGAIEISAPMAAAALLGMPAETCSDSFWVAFVTAAITYALHHPDRPTVSVDDEFADIDLQPSPSDEDETGNQSEEGSENTESLSRLDEEDDASIEGHETIAETIDDDEAILDDFFNETEPIVLGPEEEQRQSSRPEETTVSSATIYKIQDKVIPVPQHLHYAFRGSCLATWSLYEYVALIDVTPLSKHRETQDHTETTNAGDVGGRATNGTFAFAMGHPLAATHVQRIRSKTKVPVLVGPPPQMPAPKPAELTDAWKRQARDFANYILTLYRPWLVNSGDGGTLPG